MATTNERKLATEGYSEAVKFSIETAKGLWEIFRNMLAANSFMVILIGAVKHLSPSQVFFPFVLGVFGLLICLTWFLLTKRMAGYNNYYYSVARELEEIAFGDTVRTVRDGGIFANGSQVKVGATTLQMCGLSRLFRVQTLVYLVIFSFCIIYFFLFFVAP